MQRRAQSKYTYIHTYKVTNTQKNKREEEEKRKVKQKKKSMIISITQKIKRQRKGGKTKKGGHTLVAADCRRHSSAFDTIERLVNHRTVAELHLSCLHVLLRECMLTPVLVHGLGGLASKRLGVVDLVHTRLEVFARMCTAALL